MAHTDLGSCLAWTILYCQHGAKEEADYGEVEGALAGEAAEGGHDDPDVGAQEGEQDPAVVTLQQLLLCLLENF